MRTIVGGAGALMLVTIFGGLCSAGDREQALAVLDRGIKAHGGEQALAKTQTMIRTARGVIAQSGKDLPFNDEMSVLLPDRWRLAIEIGPNEQKLRLLFVVN